MQIVIRIIVCFILLILLGLFGFAYSLQTQYAPAIVSKFLSYYLHTPVQVMHVEYDLLKPYNIGLKSIQLTPKTEQTSEANLQAQNSSQPFTIDSIQAQFKENPLEDFNLIVESLEVQGINLTDRAILRKFAEQYDSLLIPTQVEFLTLEDVEFVSKQGWLLRDAKIQINAPHWSKPAESGFYFPFYGEVQAQVDQVYWQGIALDKFILDAKVSPESSLIYALAFNWQQGRVKVRGLEKSAQTQQIWQIEQAQLSDMRIDKNELSEILNLTTQAKDTEALNLNIPLHIADLSFNDVSIAGQDFSLEHLNLDLQNAKLNQGLWQQESANVRIGAQAFSLFGELFELPALEAKLEPQNIELTASTQGLLGRMNLSGQISPEQLNFTEIGAHNLRWFPSDNAKSLWAQIFDKIQNIQIDKLDLSNIQYTDINHQPKIQLTGFSADGKDLNLMQQGKWGLWQGQMTLEANKATYDSITSEQPIIKLTNQDQKFKIERFFFPLADGVIKATGEMDLASVSRPWELNVQADGLPLRLYSRYLQTNQTLHWPLYLDGFSQAKLSLNGLGADRISLNHTLSGNFELDAYDVFIPEEVQALDTRQHNLSQTSIEQPYTTRTPVELSKIAIKADRGKIQLMPFSLLNPYFKFEFSGSYDLIEDKSSLIYSYQKDGKQISFDPTHPQDSTQRQNESEKAQGQEKEQEQDGETQKSDEDLPENKPHQDLEQQTEVISE